MSCFFLFKGEAGALNALQTMVDMRVEDLTNTHAREAEASKEPKPVSVNLSLQSPHMNEHW